MNAMVEACNGIKHVIWDFNGTLLNDLELCINSINPLLKSRQLPLINKTHYQEVFTFPVREYYQRIGFDFNKEPFEKPAMQFIEHYKKGLNNVGLFAGIEHVLEYLNCAGITQSVLSAMHEPFLKQTINTLNIAQYFVEVAGIQDHYAHSKVERGIKLMNSLSFSPHETLLIGDTLHDAEVAKSLGVRCLLVSFGHYSHQRLKINGNLVVESVDALMQALNKKSSE